MMQFNIFCVLLGAALASETAYGAIRVYNPETGESEAAPTLEGAATPSVPSITTAPRPSQRSREIPRRAPVQPILLESEIEAPINDNLGRAYFFLESNEYNPTLMKELKEVQETEGLITEIYVPAKNPKQYLREIASSKHLRGLSEAAIKEIEKLDLQMRVDSSNEAFNQHRPGGWQKVVYYTPDNSRRVYNLPYGLNNLQRHVKRTRDAQRGRR